MSTCHTNTKRSITTNRFWWVWTHGLAGSAPVLALVPAVESSNAWFALGYVALFSLGVLMTMIVFGLGFGYVQSRLIKLGERGLSRESISHCRAFDWIWKLLAIGLNLM